MSRELRYQIRRRNNHGKVTWEVWEYVRRKWGCSEWKYIGVHMNEKSALATLKEMAPPHYEETQDYDENGDPIFYSW